MPLLCDNESAVKIATNPVQHSRTKNINVHHHHFLRNHQTKRDIKIEMGTDDQLVDIIHQATWWSKILQAKKWVKHSWLLQHGLKNNIYMINPSSDQSKGKISCARAYIPYYMWLVHTEYICDIKDIQCKYCMFWAHVLQTKLLLLCLYDTSVVA